MKNMKKELALLVVMGMVLVAFQVWGAESKLSNGMIDITKLTCKEAMGGNDMDRAVTAGYFHGFLAGKKGSTVVDLDATSAHSDRVMDYCLSNPTSTVMEAFTKTAK